MYLDSEGEYFAYRPERDEERVLYDYVRRLARRSPGQAVEDFYRLLLQANTYPHQEVRQAIEIILQAPDIGRNGKYIINRCFYSICNPWQLDPACHGDLRELILRVEHLPTTPIMDRVTRRWHEVVHDYTAGDLYPILKRQMHLLEGGSAVAQPEAPPEEQKLGTDLKRHFFVHEVVATTKDLSPDYRHSIRKTRTQAAHRLNRQLRQYADGLVGTEGPQVPNPTLIPDGELGSAIATYQPTPHNPLHQQVRAFDQTFRHFRHLGDFRRELHTYVLHPLVEANSQYRHNHFQSELLSHIRRGDDDSMTMNHISVTEILRRVLQFLVVRDIHHPSAPEFHRLIRKVGHQTVTTVLLRIVLLWRRVRSWLEDRFGILFHHHESHRKQEIPWVVQAFEHMNVALALNARELGYFDE